MLHLLGSRDVGLREAQRHREPLGATLPEKIDGNLSLHVTKNKQLVTSRKYLPREADNFHCLWITAFSSIFRVDVLVRGTYVPWQLSRIEWAIWKGTLCFHSYRMENLHL